MRAIHQGRRSRRVRAPLYKAGIALALVLALAVVLRALPVGGSAYYVQLSLTLPIVGTVNLGPIPVANVPPPGGTDSAGGNVFLGVTIPLVGDITVIDGGAVTVETTATEATDTVESTASGGQLDLFPPLLGTDPGLLRVGAVEVECRLNPTEGIVSVAALTGAESGLLPDAIDTALFASPPPNTGATIAGLGDIFWHEVEKEQSGNFTIYRVNGVRIEVDTDVIPLLAGLVTGDVIVGHVECIGTRPIPTSVSPATGPAGTTVTITGTGFIDGPLTTVDFAGVPATSFTVVSDTEIQATVPELRGGDWAVSVTTHVDRGTLPAAFESTNPVPGTTVDGDAFGVSLQLTPPSVLGLALGNISVGPVPVATLPEGGGRDSNMLEGIGTPEDGGILGGGILGTGILENGLLFGGAMTATTEGSGAGVFMRSEATAADIDLGGGLLTFDAATATCELNETTGMLEGSTEIVNLGSSILPVNVIDDILNALALNTPNVTVNVPGLGEVVINEQIAGTNAEGQSTLTVRGLRVTVNPAGTELGELILLEANCAVGEFAATPTIASVTPPSGPVSGGTVVTVMGTGFVDGETTVGFGGVNGTNVVVASSTQLQVTTPAGSAPGLVDVSVTTPGGTATLPNAFEYLPDTIVPPTITSIEPPTGDEGTDVTVTGEDFQDGAEVTICGQTVPATFVSETEISFVAPACPEGGPQDVTVCNPDGGCDTELDGFTYPSGGPTIDPENGISPPSGPVSGGTVVIIKGTNFVDGMTVTFDGTLGTGLVVHDSMTLEVTTPPAPSGMPGPVDVTVTTSEGSDTATDGFEYTEDGIVPPNITDISPPSGTDGTEVTIDGEDFQTGAIVTICGQDVTPEAVSATQVVFIAPVCPEGGPQDVTLCNPDGGCDTEDAGFTYGSVDDPTVSGLDPTSGPHAGGTEVIIIGTNFVAGANVFFGTVPSTNVEVLSPTVMRVFTPPSGLPDDEDATVHVTVSTPGGSFVAFSAFTYTAEVLGPPTIDEGGITPPSGPVSGGTLVTITGTNFEDGMTVTFDGAPGTSVNVLSDTVVQVVTPAAPSGPGPVDVVVTTSAGSATAVDGFTYVPDSVIPPNITGVSPSSGNEGTEVTVTGENFQDGAEVIICGQTVSTTFISANQITFIAPPCPEGGTQDVTVVNPDGGSDTEPAAFTYGTVPPPTAASITPNWGPHAGGTETIITGTNFVAGTTVTFGGVPAAEVEVLNSTTLRVVTPPSGQGPAPVVVDVTVTTSGGAVMVPGGFTYTAPTDGDCDGDGMTDVDEIFFGLDPCDPTGDNGADGDPDGDGQKNGDEVNGDPPSHPRGFFKQYLAEGATGVFFHTEVGILNASQTAKAGVLVSLFPETAGGTVSLRYELEAMTRTTVDVNQQFPGSGIGVSAFVESDQPVAAMRQMRWDSSVYGSTLETGVPDTSTTWLFAEGATYIFDLFLLLENPNRQQANVEIRYLRGPGQGPPVTQQVQVPANSRLTVWANAVEGLQFTEVAAVITSDLPVVAERAMYLTLDGPTWRAGQAGAGVPLPSTTWDFAEGATHHFDTFLLLGNQGIRTAQVTVTYLLPDGSTIVRQHTVEGQSRRTILVDTEDPALASTAVAISVVSNEPIIAERAMWWGPTSLSWYESHASLGTSETGTTWAIGAGASGGSAAEDTFVLVSNASSDVGQFRVTIVYDDGTSEQQTFDLMGNQRVTLLMRTEFPSSEGQRFSVLVESLGGASAVPIAVECARYQSTNMLFGNGGGAALATKIQ